MGLARSCHQCDQLTEEYETGSVVGTADFISPEQAINSQTVDIRSDIYSLGATFFMLCTGRPPFQGTTAQKLAQHQNTVAPSISEINQTFPDGLARIVMRMLAKLPDERFAEPAEVIQALQPWLPKPDEALCSFAFSNSRVFKNSQTMTRVMGATTPTQIHSNSHKSTKPSRSRLFWMTLLGIPLVSVCLLILILSKAYSDPSETRSDSTSSWCIGQSPRHGFRELGSADTVAGIRVDSRRGTRFYRCRKSSAESLGPIGGRGHAGTIERAWLDADRLASSTPASCLPRRNAPVSCSSAVARSYFAICVNPTRRRSSAQL